MASAGIKALRAPVRAPRANAFAERWVRTVREECLDQLLLFSRRQLEVVLSENLRHYNEARPHRGLQLGGPGLGRPSTAGQPGAMMSSAGSSTSTGAPPDRGARIRYAPPDPGVQVSRIDELLVTTTA